MIEDFEYESKTFDYRSEKIRTVAVDHHRNGTSGEGFWAVIFDDINPVGSGKRMMAVVFDSTFNYDEDGNMTGVPEFLAEDWKNPAIAVFDIEMVGQGVIGPLNMWRGDHYLQVVVAAIQDYNKQMDKFYVEQEAFYAQQEVN